MRPNRPTALPILTTLAAFSALSPAQNLAISPRGFVPLAASATDQHNQSFTVTGLSGITYIGGGRLMAVMDNSDKLIEILPTLSANATIAAAPIVRALRLSESRDFEDIAYTGPSRNSALICEEDTPGVNEYSLADGTLIQRFATPPVYFNRRANRGFEPLTLQSDWRDGASFWTANEEALTIDGPTPTQSAGAVVRLLRFQVSGNAAATSEQLVYITAPVHSTSNSSSRSGLCALVSLPSGRMLSLERSLSSNPLSLYQSRIYEITLAGATDVSANTNGLVGQTYSPVSKRLLWSGSATNLEGLALGPRLTSGNHALLGIVDDGDPISVNRLYSFELSGPVAPNCIADTDDGSATGTPDGGVTIEDLIFYLGRFDAGHPSADVDDGAASGTPDGGITIEDLLYFLARFDAGC